MYCKKCGRYSGNYPLCKNCYYSDNSCEICGDDSGDFPLCNTCYHKVKEYAEENFSELLYYDDEDYDDEYESYSPGLCVACGENKENSEYFFCTSCYKRYRRKELILSIINAKEIKILESRYYNKYKCTDGHYVKSKAEREIDNYFTTKHIEHFYEVELPIDNNPEHSIHPDFYLPNLNVYIEYWGKDSDPQYRENMNYKLQIYKKLKVTLICLYESEDSENIESVLNRKLSHYIIGTINE